MIHSNKLRTLVLAAALGCPTAAWAQVTLTDIGSTDPTPGVNDISQLLNGGGNPPGLNFYWDNGRQHSTTSGFPGQSFTTGSNPSGYTLTSVAIKTAGAGGSTPTQTQSFTLCIYQLSGTGLATATLISSNAVTSALLAEDDWMQWSGLAVSLQPNTTYAYGFGITPNAPENWEELDTASGWPYTGGQACEIVNAGGKVTYSSSPNTYDATFDIGLILPAAPIASAPVESPSYAHLGVLAGTSVKLTASAAGSTPISFYWLTDGGSGGTLTNIPGATGTNLVVDTTGWANGSYQYEFIATNSLGSSTSSVAIVKISSQLMVDIGTNTPTPGANDIAQLSNALQNDDGLNYYTDGGAGHGAWSGQTFTTGTNSSGYVVSSLAWKSAGNGNSFGLYQLYDLYFYTVSADGTTATLISSNQVYGGGVENDWFKFVGLNVPLAPNAKYAYAIGRDSTASGWEHVADQGGDLYAGGQLCTIPAATGGAITYGSAGTSDATFDLGLTVTPIPHTIQPSYTPNVNPIYAGTTITLQESAVGGLPLSYQWLTDGGSGGTLTNVPSATLSNLVVNTTSLVPGNYNYSVIVTNSYGASTSAVVTLNIVAASAPQLVTDISPAPANEGYVGQTLTFSASYTGTLPINYQWTQDTGSGPIAISPSVNPSAASNVLTLSSLKLTDAGIYAVNAQNSIGGPTISSSSTLTVLPDPAPPASGTYGAMVLGMGPVAYWRLNEMDDTSTGVLPAYDASGNNFDGRYGQNTEEGAFGISGPQAPTFPGFETTNTALLTLSGTTNSWVNLPPLNLNTNTVTIAMWINPVGNVPASAGLLMNRKGNDAAGFGFGTTANADGMYELGYTWNTNSSATWGFHSGLYPVIGTWSFVALVVQTNQATIYLYYIDPNTGQPDLYSAVNPIAHGPEQFSGGTTWIGDDQNSVTRVFNGDIDEVTVLNKALTSDQILALFSKGAGLSPVVPSIASQPQSVGAYAGNNVKFTAGGINGSSPISYQWLFNGSSVTNTATISGAQTPSLTISNVTSADAGVYELVTSNFVGITVSSNATLTVAIPVPGSYEAAALADNPYVFWKLNDTNDPSTGTALAFDFVRGLNGTYQNGAQNGFDGILGPQLPGFPANVGALATFANVANSYVSVPANTLLVSNLTYTMWINPSGPVENWAGLLMDRGGVGQGLGFGGLTDGTGMSELGYTWDQNSTWSWDSNLFPPANEWSFVAMVIEPAQATVYLINSNGVQSAVNNVVQDAETIGTTWRIGDDAQGGSGARTFPGSISDVAIYLSSLSSSQISSLYNTGVGVAGPVNISIVSAGGGSMTLSWSQGTLLQSTNVAGPWVTNSAASPYSVPTTNSMMFYRIRVN